MPDEHEHGARPPEWNLDARLESWVHSEIISAEQAAAIRDVEHVPAPDRTTESIETDRPSGRVALSEVLAYVGAALVVTASLVMFGQYWDDIGIWGRIGLSVLAGVVLTATGLALVGSASASTVRVGQAALLLATAPVGLAVGLLADQALSDESLSTLIGFSAASAFAVAFYVRRHSAPQQLAMFLSAFGATTSLGDLVAGDEGSWVIGLAIVALGLIFLVLSSTGRLPPRLLGEISGIIALGIGSFIVVVSLGSRDAEGIAAAAVWIALAIGLIAAGVTRDDVPLIVGGVLGLVLYVPWITTEVLGDGAGGPISLLISGGLLVGMAVYLTKRSGRREA